MFVAIGHDPGSELVRDQLDTDPDGYVLVHAPSSATSVAGRHMAKVYEIQ